MKDYDPQMHSAEHILNGTIVKMFGCERAFTTHIERKKSKIDIKFHRALTEDEINEITDKVNSEIKKAHDVSEEFLSPDEAGKEFDISRLPEDAGDKVRVVKIGDYDRCLCIGPHVKNTSEIGEFRITTADFNDGVLRVRFKIKRPA